MNLWSWLKHGFGPRVSPTQPSFGEQGLIWLDLFRPGQWAHNHSVGSRHRQLWLLAFWLLVETPLFLFWSRPSWFAKLMMLLLSTGVYYLPRWLPAFFAATSARSRRHLLQGEVDSCSKLEGAQYSEPTGYQQALGDLIEDHPYVGKQALEVMSPSQLALLDREFLRDLLNHSDPGYRERAIRLLARKESSRE